MYIRLIDDTCTFGILMFVSAIVVAVAVVVVVVGSGVVVCSETVKGNLCLQFG